MEALTAVSVACLTLYDMLKAIDQSMRIEGLKLIHKSGGKRDFTSDEQRDSEASKGSKEIKSPYVARDQDHQLTSSSELLLAKNRKCNATVLLQV